jgi:hypothetical protein
MTAEIYNTRSQKSVSGVRQDPPPPGSDWAFQFTIPSSSPDWLSTDSCTLGVVATDALGASAPADPSTGLKFV